MTPTKIAITGHTKGIGKELYDYYSALGIEVLGFSRTNGYDISKADAQERIINESLDCDLFINSAYFRYSQIDLLQRWYGHHYKKPNFMIVNLSSLAGDASMFLGKVYPYGLHKKALDDVSYQMNLSAGCKCKIINVKPGHVKTDFLMDTNTYTFAQLRQPRSILDLEKLIKVIAFTIDISDENSYISSITYKGDTSTI
jgi:NADP-dependent 3-hydroxy acid dehydrogenase YdfG